MTNSTTLSSNRDKIIKKILEDIAGGDLTLEGGLALLPDYVISYLASGETRKIEFSKTPSEIKISFGANDLKKVLMRYQSNKMSSIALSEWATFVLGCEAYVPFGDTEEERWQSGDGPVWDILQRLATPSIFAEITPHTIGLYIEMIDMNTN